MREIAEQSGLHSWTLATEGPVNRLYAVPALTPTHDYRTLTIPLLAHYQYYLQRTQARRFRLWPDGVIFTS